MGIRISIIFLHKRKTIDFKLLYLLIIIYFRVFENSTKTIFLITARCLDIMEPIYFGAQIACSYNTVLVSMNFEISMSCDIVKVELNMKLIKSAVQFYFLEYFSFEIKF